MIDISFIKILININLTKIFLEVGQKILINISLTKNTNK